MLNWLPTLDHDFRLLYTGLYDSRTFEAKKRKRKESLTYNSDTMFTWDPCNAQDIEYEV